MDSARLPITETRNIPHMQLFHHLKQKFPDLKDNDVNESIQKYGLDRERCEEELSQKNLIHHGGYYGPWGRPGSGLSSPSLSRVTSPIRTGVPSTPTTPVITTTTATTSVLHHTTATHHIFGPLQSSGYLAYSYGPGPGPLYTSPNTTTIATSPASYQPPINSPTGYGWHPSVTNGFRAAGIYPPPPRHHTHGGYSGPETPFSSRETSKSRSTTPNLPNSAPVIPNSYDPFNNYEQLRDPPERRKSAETNYDLRRGLYYNTQNLEHYLGGTNEYQYHSPTPPLNCNLDSPATPSTTTTTTITTTSSNCIDPSNVSSSSTVNRPPPGPRHISSVHLTPVLPHGAHHAPGPPLGDGTVSVCNRSYTSVNLQLRQPSSEPQPPIQIRSSGSSLTYSTSSLDHRHGSRSSLQISIGPTGGTISAMRTNLDNKNSQANTAFHIQYSSSASGSPTPSGAAFPTSDDVVGQEVVHGQSRRPQTWYVSDPVAPEPTRRKSSLPECVGPPVSVHPLHYPPCADSSSLVYSAGEPVWAVPPARPDWAYSQAALVQEQSARKRKLEAELVKQMDEKGKLQNEVEMMARELEAREHQRKGNADTNTKRIEDVQRENQRLQSECYEMENQILRIAPDMEQEEYPSVPPNVPYTEVSPTPQLPLPSSRASSGSSMGSGGGTPQTPHTPYMPYTSQSPGVFIPPRPTMPPPPPPPPTSLPNHTYREFQNAPPGPVDEAGRMWGCTKCTFINHPDMNKCEMCDYPRFTIGELQDIHIQVRHQNFQSPRSQEYPGWAMV